MELWLTGFTLFLFVYLLRRLGSAEARIDALVQAHAELALKVRDLEPNERLHIEMSARAAERAAIEEHQRRLEAVRARFEEGR